MNRFALTLWPALALLSAIGCAPSVIPPARVGQTLTVHVADYGYHSSLILPRQSGGLIEYAYGDWNYFARNEKSVGTAVEALLASKQATLGRRIIPRLPAQARLQEAIGAISVSRFDAPRERVERLERELEQRFAARLDSIMWSYPQQLYFVPDPERYSLTNNCNDLTARWLEQLGCKVTGVNLVTSSKFRFAPQAPAGTSPTDPPTDRTEAIVAGNRSADGQSEKR